MNNHDIPESLADLLPRLKGVRSVGIQKYQALCPAHDDHHPSLSIGVGQGGRVLLKCHAGCPTELVLEAIGWTFADLNSRPAMNHNGAARREPSQSSAVSSNRRCYKSAQQAIAAVARACGGKHVRTFKYRDRAGNEVFRIARFALKEGEKTFRPLTREELGWRIGDPPGELPLYRLPELPQAEFVLVVEGEGKVDALRELGFVATTSAHGAKAAGKSDWTPLEGEPVFILPDNDEAGGLYADSVTQKLIAFDNPAHVVTVPLPGLSHGEDVVDWIDRGGAAEELQRILDHAENERAHLPSILVRPRQLREITAEVVDALVARNNPPVLYLRGGQLVRVIWDETGRPRIELIGPDELRSRATRCADFVTVTKDDEIRAVLPPCSVMRDVLAIDCNGLFPPIRGITEIPVLRPDGTILMAPGYDPKTNLVYAPSRELKFPSLDPKPTPEKAWRAAQFLLQELLVDFPFVEDGPGGCSASRANMVATLLTPIVLPLIEDLSPLALLDAPEAGTGKGLLTSVLALVASGRDPILFTAPKSEDEWRKQITSTLLEGGRVITIDNITDPLVSPNLAAALTAKRWNVRILGVSKNADVPVQVTWTATGNNLRVGGDLPRRCYWIRVDAKRARPWEREGFKHPQLRQWALENRGVILAALLTMVRAWVVAGRPSPGPILGSFEAWSSAMSGILKVAGIEGFLANLNDMHDRVEDETRELGGFLEGWRDQLGYGPFRAAEIAERLRDDKCCVGDVPLRALLPGRLLDALENNKSFTHRLGRMLASIEGRRFTDDGLRVERAGLTHKLVAWCVKDDTRKGGLGVEGV